MIDIIEYSEDPKVFISNALSPATVINVIIDDEEHSAIVIVPDNQLSLAIGKRGQNARLAVRLTKWKIDIKSVSEAIEEGIAMSSQEEETTEQEDLTSPVVQADEEDFWEDTTPSESEEEEEEVVKPEPLPIYDDDEEEDYEYEDDELSKYDEEIDYDAYDEYYDEN